MQLLRADIVPRQTGLAASLAAVLAGLLATPPAALAQPPATGAPLPGLTSAQLTDFNNGLREFQRRVEVADGLGPIFNQGSCVACHTGPAPGGSSPINTTRFGRTTNGAFDPLTSLGGSLLQERAINPTGLEHVPSQANITARRQTPPLFGAGLIDAIPEKTILAGVRKTAVNGVLGRAAMVTDPATGKTAVGRFGWKAQHATLLAMSADAYVNELGLTNRLFTVENAPNGNKALLTQLDKVSDPEDRPTQGGKAAIDRAADFMRLLAPLPPGATNVSTVYGAGYFLKTGCASCHTPSMTTGVNAIAALSAQSVPLYSDLLLHDMGTLGDGIAQGAAGPKEMRTPPLWGLRASAPYLHDGRAQTIDAAIRAHDGEAKFARDQYLKLTSNEQSVLVMFLNSL